MVSWSVSSPDLERLILDNWELSIVVMILALMRNRTNGYFVA